MSTDQQKKTRPNVSRRKFLRGVGLVSAQMIVAACAKNAATTEPTQVTAAATQAPATQVRATEVRATQAPPTQVPTLIKPSQDIIMGIGSDMKIMDPRIQVGAQVFNQTLPVLEPLLFADNAGEFKGVLASSWEPLPDHSGWKFHLRPGIEFDNGEPFNAEAVKFSIDSVLDPANESWVHADPRSRMNGIREVVAEDDSTVVFLTESWNLMLPPQFRNQPILPPKYAAQQGKGFGVNPVGTGRYKFVEYVPGSHLHLEAKPGYSGQWDWDGVAKNDSLTFRYLAESATRVAALEAGEVHIIDNVSPDVLDRIRENPGLEVVSGPTARINGMFCNCGREPFNDVNARKAVAHAIDKEALVATIMGGLTDVATEPMTAGTLGTVGEAFAPYEYDLAKAKQYFEKAGLSNGTKIKIGGPVGRYINDKQVTTAVASMLIEVGFDVEIEQLEWGTYWTKVTNEEYDLFYVGWCPGAYDPSDFAIVYKGWGDDNAGLTHFVEQNERIVQLYEAGSAALSREEAREPYTELAHLLWDNLPVVQMFYEPNITAISSKVKGWSPRRDTQVFLWSAYLEE